MKTWGVWHLRKSLGRKLPWKVLSRSRWNKGLVTLDTRRSKDHFSPREHTDSRSQSGRQSAEQKKT